MRSLSILVVLSAAAASVVQCGGGSSPTAPGAPTPAPVTVSIVGLAGNGSYVPNPVPTSGNQVMFKNNDLANTHHIVMDDGSADFGDIAPGQTSKTVTIKGSANFHCATHPWMVGAVNQAVPDQPPCTGGPAYCD
jgi:hypothetical protein